MAAVTTPRHTVALLRYATVGVVATAVHYAVLALAVEVLRWPAWVGSGVGAVVGAQVAYLGNLWLTFRGAASGWLPWLRFQATAAAGALAGMGVVALAVTAGLHYLLAQVLATLLVMLMTYGINRNWSFRPRPNPG